MFLLSEMTKKIANAIENDSIPYYSTERTTNTLFLHDYSSFQDRILRKGD
jgi:hypothetical protein